MSRMELGLTASSGYAPDGGLQRIGQIEIASLVKGNIVGQRWDGIIGVQVRDGIGPGFLGVGLSHFSEANDAQLSTDNV